jgi:hypothetical protein
MLKTIFLQQIVHTGNDRLYVLFWRWRWCELSRSIFLNQQEHKTLTKCGFIPPLDCDRKTNTCTDVKHGNIASPFLHTSCYSCGTYSNQNTIFSVLIKVNLYLVKNSNNRLSVIINHAAHIIDCLVQCIRRIFVKFFWDTLDWNLEMSPSRIININAHISWTECCCTINEMSKRHVVLYKCHINIIFLKRSRKFGQTSLQGCACDICNILLIINFSWKKYMIQNDILCKVQD